MALIRTGMLLALLLPMMSGAAPANPQTESEWMALFTAQAQEKTSFKLLQRMNKMTRTILPRQQIARRENRPYVPDQIDFKYAAFERELHARRARGEAEASLCVAWLRFDECRAAACEGEVVAMVRHAADAGLAIAMDELGKIHRDGYGVPASASRAAEWFYRAAVAYRNQDYREAALASARMALDAAPQHAGVRELIGELRGVRTD